jgi:SWI/SNF-related matrix-associated actin-dependent regulator of chromatin subfamily D
MKFAEIPQRLNPLLHPPDPIVINHIIRWVFSYKFRTLKYLNLPSVKELTWKSLMWTRNVSVEGAEQKQTACYDIDVEVDDTLKAQMNNFLLSTASQQEIQVKTVRQNYNLIINRV